MTPELAPRDEEAPMPESTPTVGRWLPGDPDGWWECDGSAPARCVRLHGPSVTACGACGTKRPSLPETPRVGRWTSETTWACPRPCLSPNHVDRASCDVCHAVRPPLPETPAPRVDAADARAQYVAAIERERDEALAAVGIPKPSPRFLTDAQVVGKEPIAGVDDAGRVKDAIVPLSLDERMALEDSQCFENCGACVNACGDAPDGMPFRVAVARRDIWHALRFASTAQAIAQLDEVAGRMGISPCGDAETVAAFHLRVTDAIVATLRAVPVEGRPLAAAITDHPVSVEDAVKLLREAEQELSGGEGNHEILGAECGVMADRLAALVTPTPSEDRPDAE